MGYSYAAKAGYVIQAIQEIMERDHGVNGSNCLPNGFWEYGREQADGAIVGTVWKTVKKYTDEERKDAAVRMGMADHPEWVGDPATKAGSFRIEPDGKIKRFPQLNKAQKEEAYHRGLMRYEEIHTR